MWTPSQIWRKVTFRTVPPRSQVGALNCQFVITSMPVGGAETLLVNLMRRLDPSVVRPEVICMKDPGPLGEEIADEFPVHCHLLRSKWDLGVLPRLVRLLRRRRADVVITVGAGDKMFWGRLAASIAGVPVIASALHSTGWPDGVGKLNRLLTPITDAFIAVADSHGEFLSDFERFPKRKVHVIRNGVDCERFKPDDAARESLRSELKLTPDAKLIGIVAALRSEKNHLMLVDAAQRLRESFPDAHWVIVGDGPERAAIEARIGEYSIGDRFHLLGTRHDTPRILAGLDVFTLCSLNEAFPVSILEALACGVPVAASDVGSINESVVDNETGYLFATEDVQGMSDAIARLLSDPREARTMGRAGRDRVIQTGSLESMVRGYERLATELYERARVAERSSATRGVPLPGSAKAASRL